MSNDLIDKDFQYVINLSELEEQNKAHYAKHPILDKDGKPLTPDECLEYENDVFDCGIPLSKAQALQLWEKWGERLGIEKPE
jgi:hypothetical protein